MRQKHMPYDGNFQNLKDNDYNFKLFLLLALSSYYKDWKRVFVCLKPWLYAGETVIANLCMQVQQVNKDYK